MSEIEFSLRILYVFIAVVATSVLSWKIVPILVGRWIRGKTLRASEQAFFLRVMMGLSAALQITLLLDVWVHTVGGQAYLAFLAPYRIPNPEPTILTGIRDGMAANLLFFLAAGVLAARAAWSHPEGEKIGNRVQMLFPKLSTFDSMVASFVELAIEQAAPAESIRLEISIEDYDAQMDAYKILVHRRETFVNLLEKEKYTSKRFRIHVFSDDVHPPNGIVGCVLSASFVQLDSDNRFVKKVQYLKARQHFLTTAEPSWSPTESTLEIPGAGRGIWKLEYWYWAKCGSAYSSASRRPAHQCLLKVTNGTKRPVDFELTTDKMIKNSQGLLAGESKDLQWPRAEALPAVDLVFLSPQQVGTSSQPLRRKKTKVKARRARRTSSRARNSQLVKAGQGPDAGIAAGTPFPQKPNPPEMPEQRVNMDVSESPSNIPVELGAPEPPKQE